MANRHQAAVRPKPMVKKRSRLTKVRPERTSSPNVVRPMVSHVDGRSVFRVGSCWATIWCNEHQQKSGPNEHTTRIIRSVNLERRFWNEKLKDGQGD